MSSIIRRIINTPYAPKPIGPYSQSVLVDSTLYMSGQIGINPVTSKLVDGGIEAETRQALENVREILKAAGTTFSNVVKCNILVTNMDDYSTVNGIYSEYFSGSYPARVLCQVSRLPAGAKIEIEAVAVVGSVHDVQ